MWSCSRFCCSSVVDSSCLVSPVRHCPIGNPVTSHHFHCRSSGVTRHANPSARPWATRLRRWIRCTEVNRPVFARHIRKAAQSCNGAECPTETHRPSRSEGAALIDSRTSANDRRGMHRYPANSGRWRRPNHCAPAHRKPTSRLAATLAFSERRNAEHFDGPMERVVMGSPRPAVWPRCTRLR